MTMNGTERLNQLYILAKREGVSASKKEFANLIGASYTTLVRTMNGEKNYSPYRYILAAEDMLRQLSIDPHKETITLAAVMAEVKECRRLLEKLLNSSEKGHI